MYRYYVYTTATIFKSPYQFHRHRINDNHTVVCNVNGIIQSKYSDFDSIIEKREKKDEKDG